MSESDRFVLNRNEGEDVVHRNPLEQCNLDDADRRQTVDVRTAAAMIATGAARTCEHCFGPEAHI